MNENERSVRNKDELWADRGVSRGETSKRTQLSGIVSGWVFNNGPTDIDWNTSFKLQHFILHN